MATKPPTRNILDTLGYLKTSRRTKLGLEGQFQGPRTASQQLPVQHLNGWTNVCIA